MVLLVEIVCDIAFCCLVCSGSVEAQECRCPQWGLYSKFRHGSCSVNEIYLDFSSLGIYPDLSSACFGLFKLLINKT